MSQSDLDFFSHARVIAGVDEVGRGPLIGDVVAAAVVLDPNNPIDGLNDSKKLSEVKREQLAQLIHRQALSVSIARASVEEIDQLNILHATMLAMTRAVQGLTVSVDLVQIDGNRIPPGLPYPAECIVKGDGKIAEISAASIVAKVQRDQEMVELHAQHPEYGFDRHKGYGTKIHLAALAKHGVLPLHRRSFAPVRACLAKNKTD